MQQFIVLKLFCMFNTTYVSPENIFKGKFLCPVPVLCLTITLIHIDTYTFNFVLKTSHQRISGQSAERNLLLTPPAKPNLWAAT
jgi:hypothetical protein